MSIVQTTLKILLFEKLNICVISSLGSQTFKYVLNALLFQNRANYIQYNQFSTHRGNLQKSLRQKRPVLNRPFLTQFIFCIGTYFSKQDW